MSLPPPVRPGDRVGVAALSGPVDGERLARGLRALEGLGFRPVPASNLGCCEGLFAGRDAERLEAFHELAADPSLTAVFFARGGYGLQRLLPRIDWDLLAATPRAYVGYSDLTPFLWEVNRRLGLAAFHGPMVAADLARGLTGAEQESLLGALVGDFPQRLQGLSWLRAPGDEDGAGEEAAGPLVGGCLSLLTSALGTPWAPPLAGAVLFWEEVAEPLYRLDRMLTHLRLSGNLKDLSGMLVGHISWPDQETDGEARWHRLAEASLMDFSWPLGWGVASGHEAPNLTLPLGLVARLERSPSQVVFEEV